MIITIVNGKSDIYNGPTYMNETQEFQNACRYWKNISDKIVAEKNPFASAAFHKTTDSMTCRIMRSGQEDTILVSFVPSSNIITKKWVYQDKIIQNGQGGETHLKGWVLE